MRGGKAMWSLLGVVAAAVVLSGSACEADDEPGSPPPQRGTPAPESPTAPSAPDEGHASEPPSSSASPVPQVFDHAAMQDEVHNLLTGQYRMDNVGEVRCPADQPVQQDTQFHCRADVDGNNQRVPITVTSDEGDYTVGLPE